MVCDIKTNKINTILALYMQIFSSPQVDFLTKRNVTELNTGLNSELEQFNYKLMCRLDPIKNILHLNDESKSSLSLKIF